MTPDLRSIMSGRNARSRRTDASKLTLSAFCQSSSESALYPPFYSERRFRRNDCTLAAQSKTAHHSLSHTLCAAGYENPLALKLICRNGERVCHRHDRISSEAILLLESLKMWSSSTGLPGN